MSSSVVLISGKLLHFNIPLWNMITDRLKKQKLVGMLCKWCFIFFFRNGISITETRGANREFYVVALRVGVWSLFFNQFWIFLLYIPYTILFIENGEILSWILPIAWYKGSNWRRTPSKSGFFFDFLSFKSDFSSCDSSSHLKLTCSCHDIPEQLLRWC